MPKEVLSLLPLREKGLYLDATIGLGGHTKILLEALGPQAAVAWS